ncbi:hypothetical protein COO60DRAFT_1095253 [Scenedesmus sp. NREL 46B-D3]|nr:hypothetical protein COO60DRAFT_1095253 [Scenedesmus sp. NREL 46B-D3]
MCSCWWMCCAQGMQLRAVPWAQCRAPHCSCGARSSTSAAASSSSARASKSTNNDSPAVRGALDRIQGFIPRRMVTVIVYEQHSAATSEEAERREASSWDDVPAAGTAGVEIIWKDSRFKGQMLVDTCADDEELWEELDAFFVKVLVRLSSYGDDDFWRDKLRRRKVQQANNVRNAHKAGYDPSLATKSRIKDMASYEQEADKWFSAHGKLYDRKDDKTGNAALLPTPLVQLFQQLSASSPGSGLPSSITGPALLTTTLPSSTSCRGPQRSSTSSTCCSSSSTAASSRRCSSTWA